MDKVQQNKKRIFIGSAWPYANGSLHLGHMAALIGGDIIARYHRLVGNDVLFVSGSDCHGTPIAVEAEKRHLCPSEIANKYHQEFVEVFKKSQFSYDCYTKTTTENHKEVVQEFFLKLYNQGYIYLKTEELPYCPKCKRFLPDRYIEGECPKCHYKEARGDQCDECGNLMNTRDLINSKCKICNSSPEWRETEHFFLKLSAFERQLEKLARKAKNWRANAKQFTLNLIRKGLPDRAITRDIEWGVPIPIKGYENKRIYVWFEAVCGYLSASKEWAKKQGKNDEWQKFWINKDAIHYYIHGKDNIPFHTLIWPAMLIGYSNLHLPDYIVSSEYLTLEKKQFSTSRNWAVWLPDFLKSFDSDLLRYYLIINGPENSDADFSWSEFQAKINNELIANFGNLVYRTFSLIKKGFPPGVRVSETLNNGQEELINEAKQAFDLVGDFIVQTSFRQAIKVIMKISEKTNKYLSDNKPWETMKNDRLKAENDLALCGHVINCLTILINPFLPSSSQQVIKFLGNQPKNGIIWQYPLPKIIKINSLNPLYKKVDDVEVAEQLNQLS